MLKYVKCFAKRRADLAGDLEQNARPCMIHLAKLWLYPNSGCVEHWRKEVFNFYPDIDLMKPKNKVPSARFILDNTWGVKQHLKERIVQRALDSEEGLTPDPDRLGNIRSLYIGMEEYFIWLADALHEEELLSQSEVFHKLVSLGF